MASELITFASILASEGITLRLDEQGRIECRPRPVDSQIREYVTNNQAAILRELRDASRAPASPPRDTAKKPAERTERLRTSTPRRDPLVEALRGGNE